jgi:hypothetical protein
MYQGLEILFARGWRTPVRDECVPWYDSSRREAVETLQADCN